MKGNNVQYLMFSATITKWVDDFAKTFMKANYQFINMCKGLTNKIPKTVQHYAI